MGASDKDWECLSVLHGHSQDVKMVKWHPADECLISASYDDTVKAWTEEEDDWYCHQTLTAHTSTVWAVAFHPSGNLLASVGDDKLIGFWEFSANREGKKEWHRVTTITGSHSRTVFTADWSRKGVLATAGADDKICLFTEQKEGSRNFAQVFAVEGSHKSDVNCVAWDPSGTILASASDDNTIKLWAYRNGAVSEPTEQTKTPPVLTATKV
jgi:WD40 repeat protein